MTISILELSSVGVSLEFGRGDFPVVRAAIQELFGPMRRRWFVLAAEVRFGGQTFAYQNEWGDPCLISTTDRGAEMLRRLAAYLN